MSEINTVVWVAAGLILLFWFTVPIYRGGTCDEWSSRMQYGIKRLLSRRNRKKTRGLRKVSRRYRPRGP